MIYGNDIMEGISVIFVFCDSFIQQKKTNTGEWNMCRIVVRGEKFSIYNSFEPAL